MRRFDKKYNIQKANLLSEQRYLESKGVIKENLDEEYYDSRKEVEGYVDAEELNEAGGNSPYFETLSQALDAVREYVNNLGYEVDEDDMWFQFGTGGIPYETDKSANIDLLKNGEPILDKRGKELNRKVRVSIYRMSNGTYELTMYKTF